MWEAYCNPDHHNESKWVRDTESLPNKYEVLKVSYGIFDLLWFYLAVFLMGCLLHAGYTRSWQWFDTFLLIYRMQQCGNKGRDC